MSTYTPTLSSAEMQENFSEIKPAYDNTAARIEASRCLYCYDAPCIKACPTSINIPHFIQQIANADIKGSAKTIFTQNILGGACARACPTQELCEGACVFNDLKEKPIQIGRLQRHATDYALEKNIQYWEKGPDTGKNIAIVGAGPAGLSCAYELTKLGHSCTIYEADSQPGGLNVTGVAGYKVNTEFALSEVNYIKQIGIEIACNTPVGGDLSVESLLEKHDAVFLGVGLGKTASLGIEGEDLDGCMEALEFIRPTRERDLSNGKIGKKVLIVGGGNTSIDCSTAAVRLGAEEVTVVYRRTEKQMPAYKHEYELAKSDGIHFTWLSAPVRVVGENGKVTGLECAKLELTPSKNGKGSLKQIPDSNFIIPCDMVVKALGQTPLESLLQKISGLTLKKGIISTDAETLQTSVPGLFAGGDCINSGAEVVDAVEHGKQAAKGINQFLQS